MSKERLIIDIILSQKDFHLLPRESDGYCVYNSRLAINKANISFLPNKLRVAGYLDCSYNNLVTLPSGLIVGDYFDCSHNKLTSLPDDLKINGGLYCSHNQLTSLPNELIIGRNLHCSENKLTSLPDDLIVKGSFFCNNNNITTEIKSTIHGEVFMDDEQRCVYNRSIKINKIKSLING